MAKLLTLIESLTEADGVYQTEAPSDWSQGRTLYGGVTAALCAAAARRVFADAAPLRSAQFAFIGPASGRLSFRPQILRQGRSSTFVGVDCVSESGLAARATFAYGGARESQVVHAFGETPSTPLPEDCAPFFADRTPPASFFGNFEMRQADGARPFTAGAEPWFTLWVRHLDDEGVDPVIALLALADSTPPAATVSFPGPAAISTMTWSIDFIQPVLMSGWRLLRSSSEQASDGYSVQDMAVWDAEGRPLVVGRQVIAVFV